MAGDRAAADAGATGWSVSRLTRIDEPHVRELNEMVRGWRAADPGRRIPWFDPEGGGVSASVLILMEAPGPRTVRAGGSMFCSEDNDDGTARTFAGLRAAAGLSRARCVRWNVVPWAVTGSDGRWRAPRDTDLRHAAPMLAAVLAALPALQVVIAMGAPALTGVMRCLTTPPPPCPVPRVLGVPHPSQRNARGRAEALQRIQTALSLAAELVSGVTAER